MFEAIVQAPLQGGLLLTFTPYGLDAPKFLVTLFVHLEGKSLPIASRSKFGVLDAPIRIQETLDLPL